MNRHLLGGKGYPRVRKWRRLLDSFGANTSENWHFSEPLLARSLFSVSSLKCHQNRTFQHPSSLYYKMFHNFSRSYRLSVQCKFRNMIKFTLFCSSVKIQQIWVVSPTLSRHEVSVPPTPLNNTETLRNAPVLWHSLNSVEMIVFSILHCTESRYYPE